MCLFRQALHTVQRMGLWSDEELDYSQAPSLTGEAVERLLTEANTARFCSFNKDGTIHATPVWFKYEKGHILITTPERSRKARNVRRNKTVTVLVDIPGASARGVIVYGKATYEKMSTHEEHVSFMSSLVEKYMKPDEARRFAEAMFKVSRWARIIVKPERMASFDYGRDEIFNEAFRYAQRG